MDVDSQPAQPFTILRIKRKRNEEPLDALVVESRVRKKRSRKGLNVFQFAQTVEEDTWEDEKRRQDLQEQISILAKAKAAEVPPASSAVEGKPPSPTVPRPQKGDPSRRYTIVRQEEPENNKPRLPTAPPKVISHKDVPPKAADFKMYDAILAGGEKIPSPAFDSDMEKFMPMLTDYLKIHDMTPPGSPSMKKIVSSSSALPAESKSDDDYVWDVFYHRPANLSEWNAVANVGTLTGLPPSINDPNDSDSDSEPEDEADEDSNDEEYYKNEYPDEEESSDGSGQCYFKLAAREPQITSLHQTDMFHDGRSEDNDNDPVLEDDSFDEDEWPRRV
ncbi:hypothetical protein HWV62_2962 [Athelia sp. TMB]|nr:hypothetical protein HWV62_2962 [Athelia sp. TMB]